MTDYISREKFIVTCVDVYCKNCDRRKNGKGKVVYDIGDAPCRTCDIMCMLNDIECFPPADVAPVVRCRDCKFLHLSSLEKWCWNENSICYAGRVTNNWYCADGKRKEDAT